VADKPIISIIGRPNVGKSSLFNRIIGKRVAVVDDLPGVTRDRNYFNSEWNGESLTFVDTGGMLPTDHTAIPEAIHEQVRIAIQESAVVLFLVDSTTGPVDTDMQIAQTIRRMNADKVIVVVNKCESESRERENESFRVLGLGNVYAVSAQHGNGVADVLDLAVKKIKEARLNAGPVSYTPEEAPLRLAIIGRPNAGKSSFVNTLLHRNRMIVDSVAGTTRDAIDSELTYNGKKVILIDTAGLRKKSHVKYGMEYYANLRALGSIERCNICILMVDTEEDIGIQDLRILRQINDLRKGVLLVWNKWDLIEKDHKTFDQLAVETRRKFKELEHVPMLSISALTGQRTTTVIEKAYEIFERMSFRVPAAEFEDTVFSWVRSHPHPAIPENPVRFLGAKQAFGPYPHFKMFVSNAKEVTTSYRRFLFNKIYNTYNFDGCPVVIDFLPVKHAKRRSPTGFDNRPEPGDCVA